ncbi:MAG: GNAT family N-acetyltransferase [Culicoidibacterales bacterium]
MPKDELIFGAFQAGSCLGFITLYEPDAFIHYLFVSECARNQGIATALVAHCREYAQRPLTLKCLLANQSGLACYEQLGFETITVGGSECAAYACLRQKKIKE